MSLLKCPECGNEISDSAKTCVHCGYRIRNKITFSDKFIGIFVIACIATVSIIYSLFNGFYNFSGKPNNMSESVYNIGIQILEVTDDYIDGKIDYQKVKDEISILRNRVENREQSVFDSSVSILALGIEIDLLGYYGNVSDFSELIESRNKLAVELNRPKRK